MTAFVLKIFPSFHFCPQEKRLKLLRWFERFQHLFFLDDSNYEDENSGREEMDDFLSCARTDNEFSESVKISDFLIESSLSTQ
jgi:hypothetical protein